MQSQTFFNQINKKYLTLNGNQKQKICTLNELLRLRCKQVSHEVIYQTRETVLHRDIQRGKHMLRKQILLHGNKNCYCFKSRTFFVSRTQILLPKRMLPSLATMETILTSYAHAEHCFLV